MVAYVCNFSIQEAETGGLQVCGQPRLHSENLSQKKEAEEFILAACGKDEGMNDNNRSTGSNTPRTLQRKAQTSSLGDTSGTGLSPVSAWTTLSGVRGSLHQPGPPSVSQSQGWICLQTSSLAHTKG